MKLDQFIEETSLEVMRGVHRATPAAGINLAGVIQAAGTGVSVDGEPGAEES